MLDFDAIHHQCSPATKIPTEAHRRFHVFYLGLPDIIGEVTAVKNTETEPPEDTNRVMATIKLKTLLPLLDYLNYNNCCCKSAVMSLLVARDTGLPTAAPLLRGYAKIEPMTIAELSDFITLQLRTTWILIL
ncbi:hypothetical protein Bca52824_001822 [Brassica carinata]|uniref:Uncharacterized protein n=1 Tax=Brassica carinata TaxID=52824 RepID=A0A8X8BEA0_BRACI|nr:hypothetical protein Bca52824_001822 [Brassica carinata]